MPDQSLAKKFKGTRWVLLKNPENLTEKPHAELAWIEQTHPRLTRGSLIPSCVKLQNNIVKHQTAILAPIEHGHSNGQVESMNTKIRLITRIAFGFNSPDALVAVAMLGVGGHKRILPGRI